MKRALLAMLLFLCLGILDVSAQQEVRGVEIKMITYEGEPYVVRYIESKGAEYKDTWYGWELTNRNSFPVSVDIEIWDVPWDKRGEGPKLNQTRSVVLGSGESYALKTALRNARMYQIRLDDPYKYEFMKDFPRTSHQPHPGAWICSQKMHHMQP